MSDLETALTALSQRGCARATVEAVRSTARCFQVFLKGRLVEATRLDVEAHVASYRDHAPATQAAVVVRLRLLFRALFELGRVAADPTYDLAGIRNHSPPQPTLSVKEIEALLRVAGDPSRYRRKGVALALRDQACLELLYGVGLRRSEVARIEVQDLRLVEGSLIARRSKGGGVDSLPLPSRSLGPLRRYLAEGRPALADGPKSGAWLLLSHRGGPLLGSGVAQVTRRVAQAAGLRLRPHDCRRSLATHLVEAGVSVEIVRQLLGHADLNTTARYVRLGKAELRKAVGLLELEEATTEGPAQG